MKRELVVFLLLLCIGCSPTGPVNHSIETNVSTQPELEAVHWEDYTFTDLQTNETFTINSYDKPVLIESFAVWCPTCTRQQQETSKLHDQIGDKFVSIAINTDPNEDRDEVVQHFTRNNLSLKYVVASRDIISSFIDTFGVDFVNAPTVPKILRCPSGKTVRLPDGVLTASELQTEIESCAA